MESDPLGLAGGLNTYAWPGCPLRYNDPDGLACGDADQPRDDPDHTKKSLPEGEADAELTSGGTRGGKLQRAVPSDLQMDPAGVYGYVPTKQSQFRDWADWTNPKQVAAARKKRLKYHEGMAKKRASEDALIKKMKASGLDDYAIANAMVEKRNLDRIASYDDNPAGLNKLYERNMNEYDRKEGPTLEYLVNEKKKTLEEVIQGSTKTNRTMDILTGIEVPNS